MTAVLHISLHLLPIEQSPFNHTLVIIVYLLNEDTIASKMYKVHLIPRKFYIIDTKNEKILSITFHKLHIFLFVNVFFHVCIYLLVHLCVCWGGAGPNLGLYSSGVIY